MDAQALTHQLQQDEALAPLLQALSIEQTDGHWLAAPALVHTEQLDNLLATFASAEGFPGGDRRAIASLWSRWHYWAVLPAYLAALLLYRCTPTLDAVYLSAGNRSIGLRWQSELTQWTPEQARTACEHIVQQEQPLVDALCAHSRASAKVFWSNFGNLLEHVVVQLRPHPGVCPDMLVAVEHLLSHAQLADGSANPLQHPVRYVPDPHADAGALHRVRKICCLYYLLPDTALCSNCPRPLHKPSHV